MNGYMLTGFRAVAIVPLLGVMRLREAMKLPSAKLASFAGTTRCSDMSYGCCATTLGNATSAYGTGPSLYSHSYETMSVGVSVKAYPYCRNTSASQPTATLFHTQYPDPTDKNKITGREIEKTASGISCGANGCTSRRAARSRSINRRIGCKGQK